MLPLKFVCVLFCLSLCFGLFAELSTDWFGAFGGAASEEATASCFDSDGNFYIAGNFTGTFTIGSQTLSSETHTVLFVAKFSPTGQFLWVRQSMGSGATPGIASLKSISTDASGNLFICGQFKYKLGFGIQGSTSLNSPTTNDIFVAKMNASGTFLWAVQAGGSELDDTANSICISADGNPILCGSFSGYANLFGSSVDSSGSTDIFVAKLSSEDGSRLQLSTYGGISADTASSVCAISPDSFAICGSYTGSIAFGSSILNKVGKEGYVCMLNSNLSPLWAKSSEGTGSQECDAVVSNNTSIFISGRYSSAVSFDSSITTLPNIGNAIFASRLDLSGNYTWVKSVGAVSNLNRTWSSFVNGDAELFMAGSYSNTFGTLESAGSTDGFVLKLDSSGDVLWAQSLGGTGVDIAYSLCGNTSGKMLCTGYYNAGNPVILGNTPANSGAKDIFAVLFSELDAGTPAAPQNLHIAKVETGLRLSWDAVSLSESGSPISISGYRVYYSPSLADEDFQLLGQCEATSLDLSGAELSNDVRFYKVKAFR